MKKFFGKLLAFALVLGLFTPVAGRAARDGILDDEELILGALDLLTYGSEKILGAQWVIVDAYHPQMGGTDGVRIYVDYVNNRAPFIKDLQNIYAANQNRLVEYLAKETVYGYGASDGDLDDLWDVVYRPILDYLLSVRNDPATVELLDTDKCNEVTGEGCIELEVNDLLAMMCMTTETVFPAFQTFQIAPESGGVLNGTEGTDILVSRGDTVLRGGPGMDAFVVGWVGHMVIEDFGSEDRIVFPSDFFGSTLEEIVYRISKVDDSPEGLSVEFFNGAVRITFRNVHQVDALQVLALE